MKKKYGDFIMCGIFAAVILILCTQLPKVQAQARIYPIVLIGFCAILLALVLIEAVRAGKELMASDAKEESNEKNNTVKVGIYCVIVLAYITLIPRLGYIISTILFAVVSLLYQKKKNILLLILLPLVCSVAMFVVFKNVLYVTLPTGSWLSGLTSIFHL